MAMALVSMQTPTHSTFLGGPFETFRPFLLPGSSSPLVININGRPGGFQHSPRQRAAGPSDKVQRAPPTRCCGVSQQRAPSRQEEEVTRKDFPSDFMFGTGCSAFQVEGAPTSGGRGNTSWDSYVHIPGNIINGDVNYPGCDFYHRYEADIDLLKDMGFDAFRFSISWTRIYPHGDGHESPEGIAFYNKLINKVIQAGLTPVVTLFHWETPQYLENDPNVLGFRTKNIVPYFEKLARTCFQHFGDRVKHWSTINEMWTYAVNGYAYGSMAPGRCSTVSGNTCAAGDSRTEPYEVGHNLLLAHAKAYQLYKNNYKDHQQGVCGFNPCHFGAEPYSDKEEDKLATQRYLEFFSGWQIDPLVFGDYPQSMRDALGDRLPKFTSEEKEELKNSFDFLGHNYYSAFYIKHANLPENELERWFENDGGNIQLTKNDQGKAIGTFMGPSDSWIYNCPSHLPLLLEWMRDRYGKNIECFIAENGVMDNSPDSVKEALHDEERCTYIKDHLKHLSKAITDKGLNVKGYFYWSYIDNFEWSIGYHHRYGLVRVEFEDGKEPTRTLKSSAKWFQKFLAN